MARRLLLLNGLAAFSVATFHAAAYGFNALFEWTDRYWPVAVPNYSQLGSFSYYLLVFIRNLDAFTIPAFVLVTGYFIAFMSKGSRSSLNKATIFTRVSAFIAPFILWTAVRFLLLRDIPDGVGEILGTYYYVVLVVQFYLLAPVLVPFVKKNWMVALFIAGVINMVVDGLFLLNYYGIDSPLLVQIKRFFPLWFFPRKMFPFILGVAIGQNQELFLNRLKPYKRRIAFATILLLILSIMEYELFDRLTGPDWIGPTFKGISNHIFSIVFIINFLVMDIDWIPYLDKIAYLGSHSFGIYMVNIPTIYVIAVLLYHFAPWILGIQLLYQGILVTAGIGVPLLLMKLFSQTKARPYYKYVFG
jgi:hypothetical protein